ncbi:mannitol dehydrogenase family protein [Acuticoccus sp. MNP-M23]|uniref:mannitol dehydrogenase family protein n=1 Tax=Acuticoccus sp. MNP-M23 TaxID=3072793 RepID=UPI0028165D75|nr:mannitol dehydrogenase family protein [Acuticoccus sp. MNP-M23]WMS44896.1 mannitol dehydrogenase family protein [Acuticoccus sp. MNP-M23]
MRLSAATPLPQGVRGPGYDRDAHGFGIVHIGLGAFHKAHQSLYTEAALEADGGDWRTIGVSLRRPDAADALNPQDGLYSVLTRGDDTPPRVVGNLGPVLGPLSGDCARILARLTDPATRLVTLTVTEKGYGRGAGGGLDESDPAVAADLAAVPSGIPAPRSVPGLLAAALLARRAAKAGPLTVLSCDNLAGNGHVLGALVEAMAGNAALEATFPASMVDRITPASTEATFADAESALGVADHAAVETEPFTQFVVEDNFAAERPAWEAGGAVFVADVAPHEMMKLRMLNGAHSLIAYMGQLNGIDHVRDVVADPVLAARVDVHFEAARKTLPAVPGVDLAAYARALMARFANRAILHKTRQIAMDGTEKLPQRIFAPAAATLAAGGDVAPFAYATGLWMAYAARAARDGVLDDPRRDALLAAGDDPAALGAVAGLPEALATGAFMAEAQAAFRAAR